MPHRLRLASAGGPGHQGVPVKGGQRDAQASYRPVLDVQDVAQLDRVLAANLAGDVEVAGLQHPDTRHFLPGQAGQGGKRPGGRGERHPGTVGRIGQLGPEHVGELLRAFGAAQPVRVRAQVSGSDQQRRYQPEFLLIGAAHQHPDVPQARLPVRV